MNIHSLSALLAAIITFAIGLSVLLRDRRRRTYVTFAIFSFILCFWYLFTFFAATIKSDIFLWISLLFGIAIPASAERFFLTFLAEDPRKPPAISRWILGGSAAFLLALVYSLIFYPLHHSKFFTVPLTVFVLGSLCHCVYLIYGRKRAIHSRPEATRLTYLLYGGGAAVLLAGVGFFTRFWGIFSPLGAVVTVIYMYFISQTLFHYRLLDIKELLGKMVTLTALVLTLTIIYGLLLAWVGAEQSGVFFFNTIVASFVILVIFEPLRGWIEDRVNQWMFREKYEFSRRLRMMRQDMANIIDIRSLVAHMLQVLEESARVTHASIYLAGHEGGFFRLEGHLGPEPVDHLEGTKRSLFLARLREDGILSQEALEREVITQTEEAQEDARIATRNILGTMEDLEAGVCIPLTFENQLLGILNLRDDRLREAYASDELDELRRVALQAAITLRNSKVYEQMKERDRLAALGQMAAGLAHEIRNPLGAIKGAAQLIATHPGEPEPPEEDSGPDADGELSEEAEYMQIIVEEVDRLDRVVSQFLGYARPDRGDRQPLNINDVVHKTIQLVSPQIEGVELVTRLAADLPLVRVDPEQFKQVFLNLAINGIQANEGRGSLQVVTRHRQTTRRGPAGQFVEISFKDQGKGISPEMLKDIFIPFFTTKQGGTGLGLPICQRIVENHGGTIEVRSHPGKGSTFSVVLPTEDSLTTTMK